MVAMLTSWLLLILFCVAELALGTGSPRPVDIFAGEVDILQLRGNRRGGKFRNALFSNSARKWIRHRDGNVCIPDTITGNFGLEGSKEYRNIQYAMRRMEKNTCIRFVNRTDERDYVEIKNMEGEGCYTNVGRVPGSNVLMLEYSRYGSCLSVPTVQHELLHVAGLWHEHMRHDRDQYIKVIYENIKPEYHDQFDKVFTNESTTYKLPYDYTSLMHYQKTAFGYPGMITMETKDPNYTHVIGTQQYASKNDYLKVCYIYGCARCMGKSMKHKRNETKPKPWRLAPQGTDENKWKPWSLVPQGPDEKNRKPWRPAGCWDKNRFCEAAMQKGKLYCNASGWRNCCGTCKCFTSHSGWSDPLAFTSGNRNYRN